MVLKQKKERRQQAVADEAISLLMKLEAKVGRKEDLKQDFVELGKRNINGAAAARISQVKSGLYSMEHSEKTAFKCGPLAVNSLLYIGKPVKGL